MKKIFLLFYTIAIALGVKASAYSVANVENYTEEVRDSNNIINEPAFRNAYFNNQPIKMIVNGQFRIVRNDKRYTIMGVEE